jgi:hypothetical protein
LLKGIKRTSDGGDGGPNIIPHLLHQSSSKNKLISRIAKNWTTITMSNKVEHQNNPSKGVILRSTKQPTCKHGNNNLVTKHKRLHAHVDNETKLATTTSIKKEIKFQNATLSIFMTTTIVE